MQPPKTHRNRSRLAAVGAILAAALVLTACGNAGTGDNNAAGADDAGAKKVLKVAVPVGMPYAGIDKDGNIQGLDGDLLAHAAANLGYTLEPDAVDFPGMLSGVQTGRWDIGINNVAWTEERSKVGILTDPTYYSAWVLGEREGIDATTIEDLEGLTLGTVTNFNVLKALKQVPGANVRAFRDSEAVIADLNAGRIDVAFLDPLVVTYMKQQLGDEAKFHTVGLTTPTEEQIKAEPSYADFRSAMIGWYVNPEEQDMADALNEQIRLMWEDGTIKENLENWGADTTVMMTVPDGLEESRQSTDRSADWTAPTGG